MRRRLGLLVPPALVAAALLLVVAAPTAQGRRLTQVAPMTAPALQQWDGQIDQMLNSGDLQLVSASADTLLPWHWQQRVRQAYRGVPVFGADMTRDLDNANVVSILGQFYSGIDLDVVPRLNSFDARVIVEGLSGAELGTSRTPTLVILPRDDGSYVLAYDTQVMADGDMTRYFIDANTGEVALRYSNLQTQVAGVLKTTGWLGDTKKISVMLQNGTYYASDKLRPAPILIYDMKSDYRRTNNITNGIGTLSQNDLASSTTKTWTDAEAADGLAYAGYTYDYYYKRMGRKGLNDHDMSMKLLIHPIARDQWQTLYASWSNFYTNAFWDGAEVMLGEGLPSNVTAGGQRFAPFSTALDAVAHELTHGVTQYSSNLIYQGESGALNEAFSDIMGTSVEFYFQPRAADVVNGSGLMQADYLVSEDVATGTGSVLNGFRSMAKPARYGDPDHWTLRYTGTSDNGGVHMNSAIANQAYYLAIEGGTNDTSKLSVQGVGASNRDQIEKIFYRAFVYKLTSGATFSNARLATILAARELYGTGSSAETAIKQAWDAVGVDVGIVPATAKATVRAAVRGALLQAGARIR